MYNSYEFDQYKTLINILYDEHKTHTGEWLNQKHGTQYNLKKVLVSHICSSDPDDIEGFIDDHFFNYIDSYKSSLPHLYLDILVRVKEEMDEEIEGRIKGDDAIILKLHRKRFDDGGKYPLNKNLNDLLGFRIIDTNYNENIEKISTHLDELRSQNFRIMHMNRVNGEYKGYHIYFMGANASYFPMELQIWDYNQARINFKSHEVYKKDYTYWPEIYING